MVTKAQLHPHQDTQSIKYLQSALKGFREGNRAQGFVFFSPVQFSECHHDHAIYKLMWNLKHKPLTRDCEYGRHTFHDTHGLSSTAQEKAIVIDQYLKGIAIFNSKVKESRDALLKARNNVAQSIQPSWQDYVAITGGILSLASVAYGLFSAIRGTGGGYVPNPSIPGHIVVGGGHMDLSSHVVVSGGHLTNALNSLKSTADFSKMSRDNLNSKLFKKCVNEYPTPAELKERDAQYENERLDQIRKDYNQALYDQKHFGKPVDVEKFKKEIEKLAEQIGKEAWKSLIDAIGESIGAGLTIEFPPAAIYQGYKAVEDFKKFGALAEESERLRDLADRWGK